MMALPNSGLARMPMDILLLVIESDLTAVLCFIASLQTRQ